MDSKLEERVARLEKQNLSLRSDKFRSVSEKGTKWRLSDPQLQMASDKSWLSSP